MSKSGGGDDGFSCFLAIIAIIFVVLFWEVIVTVGFFGFVAWAVIKVLSSSPSTSSEHISPNTTAKQPPVILEEKPVLALTDNKSTPVVTDDKSAAVLTSREEIFTPLQSTESEFSTSTLNPIPIPASVQPTDTSKTRIIPLTNITYEKLQQMLPTMKVGDDITLLRHYNNMPDDNAIEVLNTRGESLGWLPYYIASQYAPLLDKGKQLYGRVEAIVTSSNSITDSIWVRISLMPVNGLPFVQRRQPIKRQCPAAPPKPHPIKHAPTELEKMSVENYKMIHNIVSEWDYD